MFKPKSFVCGVAVLSCLTLLGVAGSVKAAALSVPYGDSDGDGVFDITELMYGTNPNNRDTDGDGYEDGTELAHGFDPRNPQWGARFLPTTSAPMVKTAGLWVYGPSHLRGTVVAKDSLDVGDELNAMGIATFRRGIVVSQATTVNSGGTIFNSTLKDGVDNPVTIGDNVRIDGRIWRWKPGEEDGKRIIVQDGADIWHTLTVGGGYGNTGTTVHPNGNAEMNGSLQVDGTIQSGVSSILINGPQHHIRSSQALTIQTQAGQIVLFPQNSRVILKRGVGDRAAVGGVVGPTGREPLVQSGYVGTGDIPGIPMTWGEIHFEKPYKQDKIPSIVITPISSDTWNHSEPGGPGPCTAYTVHITEPIETGGNISGVKYQVRKIIGAPTPAMVMGISKATCDYQMATPDYMCDVTTPTSGENCPAKEFNQPAVPISWVAYGYE